MALKQCLALCFGYHVQTPPGNAWGAEPWDCPLPEAAGPHTAALRQLLQELEERTPYQQL